MLRMDPFEVHTPTTAAEAVALRSSLPDALYLAGGTDLLPNLKHRLHQARHLIALHGVAGLDRIDVADDGAATLGASVSLHAVATSDRIAATLPALAQAAGLVAGPQHRRMATLGGNVMLDTRCLFYNQSEAWRRALGWCLKASGDWCHVIGSGKACVAAQSSDTVPVLVALDARVGFLLPDGEAKDVALRELFSKDGRYDRTHVVPRTALLQAVHIPAPPAGHRSVYRKVRARQAVDFPQLGVALAAGFDGEICTALECVLGAVLPQPRRLRHMDRAVGHRLDDALIEVLAEHAFKQARPQTQIHGSPAWRRHMVRVEVRRGLEALRPERST